MKHVEGWFQDETRLGQQGSTSRMWVKKGTGPRALKQQQFTYSSLYGAICPSTGQAVVLWLNESVHLNEWYIATMNRGVNNEKTKLSS